MGFWFFLSVVVVGNMVLKAYKLRIATHDMRAVDQRVDNLQKELKTIREKIQNLDEAVFFGDFELKQKFRDLEKTMPHKLD